MGLDIYADRGERTTLSDSPRIVNQALPTAVRPKHKSIPAGFLLIGRNNFSPRETTIKRFQIIDNLSFLVGRNGFKAGVDVNRDRIFNFFPGLLLRSICFQSDQRRGEFRVRCVPKKPAFRVPQTFAAPGTAGPTTNPNSTDFALFFQDDIRVTPRLVLNLGIRYDRQLMAPPPVRNPDPALLVRGWIPVEMWLTETILGHEQDSVTPSRENGIAWRLWLFYGRTPAIMVGTAHSNNGINILGVTLNCLLRSQSLSHLSKYFHHAAW